MAMPIYVIYSNGKCLSSKMGLKRYKSQTSLAKPILSFLIRFTLFSCIFITTWQAWNCVVKYQENPQSTSSSMEYIGNLPLPQITICSRLIDNRQNRLKDVPFNHTKLTDCGLKYELQIFID